MSSEYTTERQPKKPILIDIDGVVADFHSSFVRYINQKTGKNLDIEVFRNGWSFPGVDFSLVVGLYERFRTEGHYEHIEPITDAPENIREIAQHRSIVFANSRNPDLEQQTRNWLNEHNFGNYQILQLRSEEKVATCKEFGIEELVDDNLSIIKRSANAGLKTFGVLRPYNRMMLIRKRDGVIPIIGLDMIVNYL